MKVSYYTTCKGRLDHLRQTLPKNLEDNQGRDVQFVLLDYNSPDGLEEWARTELRGHVQAGRVLYARERTAPRFHMSHAKNVAARLCDGDVICNLDADTYTGTDLTPKLIDLFAQNPNRVARFYQGKIGCTKADFLEVGGYDERMVGWGHEDNDFFDRLLRLGRERWRAIDAGFGTSIDHDDDRRTEHVGTDKGHTQRANWAIALETKAAGVVRVNPLGFGRATVWVNFAHAPTVLG